MKKILISLMPLALLLSCGDTTGPGGSVLSFSGGFESGTMLTSQIPPGDWDQLAEVNGVMYMSSQAHMGDWAAEASVSDSCAAPSWGAYLKKRFTYSENTLYARIWFMLQSGHNLSEEEGRSFEFMWLGNNQMEKVCSFKVGYYDLFTTLLISYVRIGAGGLETVEYNLGLPIPPDIWHYLEVAVVRDSISGSFAVWIGAEGEDPYSTIFTGVNNLTGIELEAYCIGIVDNGGDAQGSMLFDDYALSETRIGQN